MDEVSKALIQELLDTIKKNSFVAKYKATNEEAMGLLVSKFFEWDGVAILETSANALEDANFHTEAGQLFDMVKKYDEVDA